MNKVEISRKHLAHQYFDGKNRGTSQNVYETGNCMHLLLYGRQQNSFASLLKMAMIESVGGKWHFEQG